jgi:hypothetical protein
MEIAAAGERLVVYEQFGHKLDRRRMCAAVPGGFVMVNSKTGAVTRRLAASSHFREIVGSPDGRYLYGLDVGDVRWKCVRILKLDAASGGTVGTKILEDDVWSLTSGTIPQEMVGRMDLAGAAERLRR